MTRKSSIIPNAPVARILQGAGAKRVSEDAVNEFVDVLQGIAEANGIDVDLGCG